MPFEVPMHEWKVCSVGKMMISSFVTALSEIWICSNFEQAWFSNVTANFTRQNSFYIAREIVNYVVSKQLQLSTGHNRLFRTTGPIALKQ